MIKSALFSNCFLNTRKGNPKDSSQLQYPIHFSLKNPEMNRLIEVVKRSGPSSLFVLGIQKAENLSLSFSACSNAELSNIIGNRFSRPIKAPLKHFSIFSGNL